MDIPYYVKVGHRNIEVHIVPFAELEDAFGDYLDSAARIRIAKELNRPDQAETLLHELFHAIWPRTPPGGNDQEEYAVATLSYGFAQIWADNPYLVKWVTDSLRKNKRSRQ